MTCVVCFKYVYVCVFVYVCRYDVLSFSCAVTAVRSVFQIGCVAGCVIDDCVVCFKYVYVCVCVCMHV